MQALAKGYLLAGDTSAAKTAYSDLLVASPRDYDALVALATITMPADPEAAPRTHTPRTRHKTLALPRRTPQRLGWK